MSEFPTFTGSSTPVNWNGPAAEQAAAPVKKTRGPRRSTADSHIPMQVSAIGSGGGHPASTNEPAKRKGRPPKNATAAPKAHASAGIIDLLPHLVGLQEAHIKPLTKAYQLLAELPAGDRRRVASILARVFA